LKLTEREMNGQYLAKLALNVAARVTQVPSILSLTAKNADTEV
jgi:hypothetical protein